MYFEFKDTTVTTKRLANDIAVDYDEGGRVAGVEVLGAKRNIFPAGKVFSVEVEGLLQAA